MQYMVVFLADISKKYYLCRYNVTIKLADRWKTNTIGVTDEAINVDDIIETTNHCRRLHYPRERRQTYRNVHQTTPLYFEIRYI